MRPLGRKFGSEVPSNLSSSEVVSALQEACRLARARHLSGRHLATPSEVTGCICRAVLGTRPPCFRSFAVGGGHTAPLTGRQSPLTFDPALQKSSHPLWWLPPPNLYVNESLNKSVLMLAFK